MKILFGIDGSAESDAAVSLAGQLMSTADDEAVFYYSPPHITVDRSAHLPGDVMQEAHAALAKSVFDHARALLPQEVARRVVDVVGEEKPREGILSTAEECGPDLIAVGARGTSGFTRLILGSVSRAVVHAAKLPVLVARVRQKPASEPLQVVLACDQVELSGPSGEFLHRFTWPEGAVGRVVHVTESLFAGQLPKWLEDEARQSESEPLAKAWVEEQDKLREEARRQMSEFARRLPELFHNQPPVLLDGHPGEQLVDYCEREKIDLVVIGSRHHGTLERFLGGSISEHVLAHATCATLIVKSSETQ